MTKKVVGIRFKKAGKIYYFESFDMELKKYDHVIVDTAQGLEYGEVAMEPEAMDPQMLKNHIKPVLRKATPEDDAKYDEIKKKEKEGGRIFVKKVKANGLDMRLVNTEYTFDMKKALFHFTAEGRVDFRDLVRDLAATLKMRIELRQIGARDEVKNFNTIGSCGRNTCCSSWLGDFTPVSIRMAKDQGLALSSTKISGVCGRLMCCLSYESEFYKTVTKKMPKIGAKVRTPEGEGTVYRLSVLEEKVIVRIMKSNDEAEIKTFSLDEIVRPDGTAYENVYVGTERTVEEISSEMTAKEKNEQQQEVSDKKGKKQGKKDNRKGKSGPKNNGNKPKQSKKKYNDMPEDTDLEIPQSPKPRNRKRRRRR